MDNPTHKGLIKVRTDFYVAGNRIHQHEQELQIIDEIFTVLVGGFEELEPDLTNPVHQRILLRGKKVEACMDCGELIPKPELAEVVVSIWGNKNYQKAQYAAIYSGGKLAVSTWLVKDRLYSNG